MSDLDIHTLMFTAEAKFNNVLRRALLEYMKRHNHKAKKPEFQTRVFIQASNCMARGVSPNAWDILLEMGEGKTKGSETPTDQADEPPVSIQTVMPAVAPTSVQIIKVQEQPKPVLEIKTAVNAPDKA